MEIVLLPPKLAYLREFDLLVGDHLLPPKRAISKELELAADDQGNQSQ